MVDKEINTRLRKIIKDAGGITAFAKRIGISQPRLSQYLNGSRDLSIEILLRIAKQGFDLTYILTGAQHDDSMIMNQVAARMLELEKENERLKRQRSSIHSATVSLVEGLGLSLVADKKAKYSAKKKK